MQKRENTSSSGCSMRIQNTEECRFRKRKESRKRLLRGLMNVRMPGAADEEFLSVQDEYLQEALEERSVVDIDTLELPAENN